MNLIFEKKVVVNNMASKTTEEKVAEILLKTGSILLSPESPFTYSSGLYSPLWIDGRKISSFPEERAEVMDLIVQKIDSHIGLENVDIVAGTSSSGISLAAFVARRIKKPMIYIRSSAKKYGKGKQIEGAFEKGKKVVVLTDMISTQEDVPVAVDTLKEEGMEILGCFAIYDNCMKTINQFLRKNNIPLHTLTNLNALVGCAEKMHLFSAMEKKIVMSWAKNPKGWFNEHTESMKKNETGRMGRASEILLDISAVTLSPSKPYRYPSGVLSPIYTDNRLLMSHPPEWKEIIGAFADVVINTIGRQNIDVIAGTDSAGISHAAYLASILHLPMAYIKSEETPYGTRKKIEGIIKPGDRVVVVEDLISTGKSSIAAANTARNAGAIVDYCLSIFDYGLKESKKAFSDAKLDLISITNVNALLDVAVAKKAINEKEKKLVLEWQKDPNSWETKK